MSYVLIGILTWYISIGSPLRCGGTYELTREWAAVDLDALCEGVDPELCAWRCGDLIRIVYDDGTSQRLYIQDTGPLSDFCVWDGPECVPVRADLPEHVAPFVGMSARGRVHNESARVRAIWEGYR
jgi:hypothetical protein